MVRRRGVRPGDRGRKGVWRNSLGKSFEYDSLWERNRMVTLDLHGYRFTREGVRIPYQFEGKQHTYYPDFVVYDRFGKLLRIEEVKPSMRNDDPRNVAKWAAAREGCKSHNCVFLVVNERDISRP